MNVNVKSKGGHSAPCGTPADTASMEDCPSLAESDQINMM